MTMQVSGTLQMGSVRTVVTSGRGHNPEEITDMLMDRLIQIADTTPMPLREQAIAFRKDIRLMVLHYVTQAQKSQNTTIYNKLKEAGEDRAAEIVRGL